MLNLIKNNWVVALVFVIGALAGLFKAWSEFVPKVTATINSVSEVVAQVQDLQEKFSRAMDRIGELQSTVERIRGVVDKLNIFKDEYEANMAAGNTDLPEKWTPEDLEELMRILKVPTNDADIQKLREQLTELEKMMTMGADEAKPPVEEKAESCSEGTCPPTVQPATMPVFNQQRLIRRR